MDKKDEILGGTNETAEEPAEDTVKEEELSPNGMIKALDYLYQKSLEGIKPVKGRVSISKPIEEFAADYVNKHKDIPSAANAMLNMQVVKCTTSGFVTGFGGLLTMPITIPANLSSVLYVQMRMIACTAYMGGFDLHDDQVQTFVYACLAGVSVGGIVKKFGIKFGEKLAVSAVKKIPGKVLTKINQKVGFRFITKFGSKGLINLGKAVPVVGAVINGGLDLAETRIIADRAYKMFIEKDFSVCKDDKDAEIDLDDIELDMQETAAENTL